ncbi:MAG TPA: LD-carboxypeptidase [Polyangiaceae bacterium LLY-WYZ-15_(1-7)]|nr:LD-carboxypeptidase [Polyangiaceae bacterium LLY-WYZ-15_(1-7)]HJL10042.1 LD-carboxypeptidase [Polyangiaceae bacterium LLY-WYZ-15_(1-7)]HJL25728.1 LD-carboxypeptidase [Polyangiaceae bacterium LLY-WYZ-15_(1-7)]HJL32421.1 LD-carboxypeptidase [Polyangiaceae bacterium LLY-WYZ-15_(1-7)]HJL36685.1 LD-carboxypeptidase [Polyangiaceae bacterium LLY-WYZ-15_(1-7)]
MASLSPPPKFSSLPPPSQGAVLRLVAPAGPFDRAAFERGVAFLRERYELRYDEGIFAREGFLAGDDERRVAELRAALADPDASAIVAARGGYGATRLLPMLDPREVRRARKPLVGFSDLTALHALWARAGVRSIHGPMVAWLGDADLPARQAWVDAIEGRHAPIEGLRSLAARRPAVGALTGGNLAVLAALVGTPYAPPLGGSVLFLEEIGEAPYRVDRMLTTLRQAGWFDRVAGVLVGDFACPRGKHDVDVLDVVEERLAGLSVPVLAGVPSGHGEQNAPLPFGAVAALDPLRGRVRFA